MMLDRMEGNAELKTSVHQMASASCTIATFSGVTSPMMRMPRPGPGNGWRLTRYSGRPSSRPA